MSPNPVNIYTHLPPWSLKLPPLSFNCRLGRALTDGFTQVLLLDVAQPAAAATLTPGLSFEVVDVRDEAALTAAFSGASVVFHCASYGMSGAQQLQTRLVQEINVGEPEGRQ